MNPYIIPYISAKFESSILKIGGVTDFWSETDPNSIHCATDGRLITPNKFQRSLRGNHVLTVIAYSKTHLLIAQNNHYKSRTNDTNSQQQYLLTNVIYFN